MCLLVLVALAQFFTAMIAVLYGIVTPRGVQDQTDAAFLTSLRNASFKLLENLPRTVSGVGEELARGDPDLEPFQAIGKVKPHELLGFVVVVRQLIG